MAYHGSETLTATVEVKMAFADKQEKKKNVGPSEVAHEEEFDALSW